MSTHAVPTPSESVSRLAKVEDTIALVVLLVMASLPLIEMVARPIAGAAILGSQQFVAMLALWIGFVGAMLAARERRHLTLSTGVSFFRGKLANGARVVAVLAACVVALVLSRGAVLTVLAEMESTRLVYGRVPMWLVQAIMPLAYFVIALRTITKNEPTKKARMLLGLVAAALLAVLWWTPASWAEHLLWPLIAAVLLATIAGAPVFVALGGVALALFWHDDAPVAAVTAAAMQQIESQTMPTIPLFTFAGYVLAESQTSTRLVRVMRAVVGFLPGGLVILVAVVCAFFTTFTGASGVTILALGPLLLPILVKAHYDERFSVGLLTAAGSLGLLFPPSLPVIFYGVASHVPIDRMFVAGAIPGALLIGATIVVGVKRAKKMGESRTPFVFREAKDAVWHAKWELALPVLVIVSIARGWTTIVEAAALTAAYALFIEIVIYRDVTFRRLVRVGRESAILVGGVLMILGVAMGLTSYLIDAEIPARGLRFVASFIDSPWAFLLLLNLFLLVVGCLMDIYSAIAVVVPLILPIAEHYSIHPIHLGVIFLANLELGFLTPPVGMNLFLSSYRFERSVTDVAKTVLPFLLVLLATVLLITYLPWLTLTPVEWLMGPDAVRPVELQL